MVADRSSGRPRVERADAARRAGTAGPAGNVVADVSLSIQIIHDRDHARLVPIGELDVHSAGTFAIAGELAIDEHPQHLAIDLAQVTFIDSSGMRGVEALVECAARRGVPCTVVGRRPDMPFDPGSIVVWSGTTVRSVDRPA